jgi:hypothetical protein
MGAMGAHRVPDQMITEAYMPIIGNQSGASRLKVFLVLALLFVLIHAGFKLVPMYMDYERMQDAMKMKAGLAQVLKDEEIVRDLVEKAVDLDLPLTAENFILARDQERRKMHISTQWDVKLNFLWGTYIRTFHFAPSVDENFLSVVR